MLRRGHAGGRGESKQTEAERTIKRMLQLRAYAAALDLVVSGGDGVVSGGHRCEGGQQKILIDEAERKSERNQGLSHTCLNI